MFGQWDETNTGDIVGSNIDPYSGIQTPGAGYPVSTIPSTSGSGNWWNALTTGISSASNILTTRYAVPQLNPGQFISTTPYGSTAYQLAPGQGSFNLGGTSLGSMLPLLAVGVVVLLMIKK